MSIFTVAGRDYQTIDEMRQRLAELDAEHDGEQLPDDARAEWQELDSLVDEMGARAQYGNGGGLSVDRRGELTAGVRTIDSRDTLRSDQSFYDWCARSGQPGFGPEARELNFDRMIRGIVTGSWDGAEAEQRAVSESPLTAGGYMVPTPLAADIIDKARNAARVFQAGATTVPMTSQTLKYARLTTDAVPAWRSEAAAISDQAMVFDSVTLTAQSLALMVKISVELFEDAPNGDNTIRNSFAKVIALELDRVALRGTGTPPQPKGILNQTGVTITTHGANGTVIGPVGTGLGYDFLLNAVATCRQNNFEPNAVISAPRLETSLGVLKSTLNTYVAQPAVDVLPRYPTNQVPINLTVGTSSDTSEVYTGQWQQLLVGIRTDLQIRFLQERFMDNMQYAFLAYLRADIALAQPTAFVVDTGVRG
jgi:HK97 family phage major capsid protein